MNRVTSIGEARLAVADQVVSCENCELHAQCTLPVPFYGPTPANIVVIGEAPGAQEDKAGRPFIGPAGQMIRRHLMAVGIDPEEVCWINTASCFPHGTPMWKHIVACSDNKRAQIELADPAYILLLGKVALSAQNNDVEMKRIRGKAFLVDDRVNFATYHPSAALRNGNYERAMAEDLETFSRMIDVGMWTNFISDHCVTCGKWAEWFCEDGMTFCLDHAPPAARQHARKLSDHKRVIPQPKEEGVDEVWQRRTWITLGDYLQHNEVFFVDDFWFNEKVDRSPGIDALIPVLKRAAKEALILKTDERRKSKANHLEERPVWRSCIYQGVLA